MSRRVALVTGGTRGIGLGIARALAREHWTLALCGMRPEIDVQATLDDLKAGGAPEVAYWPADIGDRLARERLVGGIEARFASLDALVNNAGKAPSVRADLLEASEESFENLLRANLQGPSAEHRQGTDRLAARPMIADFPGRNARPTAVAPGRPSP